MKISAVVFTCFLLSQAVLSGKTNESPADRLPLAEYDVSGQSSYFVLMLSGDGGWAAIDRAIADYFTDRKIPVVGVNSLKYFLPARTPESTAADMAGVISWYLKKWKKTRVYMVGYSLGADVLPFIVTRLPEHLRKAVMGMTLIGLAPYTEFQFHITDWLTPVSPSTGHPVLPELRKLAGLPILCIFGTDEPDSLAAQMKEPGIITKEVDSGHMFIGKHPLLVTLLDEELRKLER